MNNEESNKTMNSPEAEECSVQPTQTKHQSGSAVSLVAGGLAIVALAVSGWVWHESQLVVYQLDAKIAPLMHHDHDAISRNHEQALARSEALQQALVQQKQLLARQQGQIKQLSKAQDTKRDDWVLFSIAERLRLANLSLAFTQDRKTVLVVLQEIDAQIEKLGDAGLLSLRQSIAKDIAAIDATPQVDLEGILSELMASSSMLSEMPLKNLHRLVPQTEDANASAADANSSEEMTLKERWKSNMTLAMKKIEKIVVIRHHEKPIKPLLTEAEASYLRHNLYFMLQQAQWAAIAGKQGIYHDSLARAVEWINTYYDTDSAKTQAQLTTLSALADKPVMVKLPGLDNSMRVARRLVEQRLHYAGETSKGEME